MQPGIVIDYATGDSYAKEHDESPGEIVSYILNRNKKKFHYENCSSVNSMKAENKEEYVGAREDLLKQGYEPCKNCSP